MEGRTLEPSLTGRQRAQVWLACGPAGRAYSFLRDLMSLAALALWRLAKRITPAR